MQNTEMQRLFAVVPAAGHSRRMGRPKLLLPLGASTVIARMLAALARPEIEATIVVIRPDDELLRAAVAACGAIPLQPGVPPPEMRDSVEFALRHIEQQFKPNHAAGWILAPADHPLLDPAVIDRLLIAWRNLPGRILVPVHRGRRGHPTLFPFGLVRDVYALPPDQGLNSLLARHLAMIEQVEVDSPGVIADLDTPEDYARLQAEFKE
jgi:molybdenum cofactor cytidylyltransferase